MAIPRANYHCRLHKQQPALMKRVLAMRWFFETRCSERETQTETERADTFGDCILM